MSSAFLWTVSQSKLLYPQLIFKTTVTPVTHLISLLANIQLPNAETITEVIGNINLSLGQGHKTALRNFLL